MSDYDRPASPVDEEYDRRPVKSDDHSDRSRSPARRSRSRSPKRDYRSRSRSPRSSSRRLSDDRRRRTPSRSRSRSKDRKSRRRSASPRRRSRSPRRSSPRRRNEGNKEFHGTRESPEISNILGVFGLSLRTRERDVDDVFREYGSIEQVTIVYDRRTRMSRGFGFVYFKDQEDASRAREALNGMEVDGRKIRVDYSVTHRPHTPTPGEYMGEKRTRGYDRDRYRRRPRSRSPQRRRYYRSRSRSRSWSRSR